MFKNVLLFFFFFFNLCVYIYIYLFFIIFFNLFIYFIFYREKEMRNSLLAQVLDQSARARCECTDLQCIHLIHLSFLEILFNELDLFFYDLKQL